MKRTQVSAGRPKNPPKRDLRKHKLLPETKDYLLNLLRAIGYFENAKWLYKRLDDESPRAIAAFLRTDEAKEAASQATPASRAEFLAQLKDAVDPTNDSPQDVRDPALPDALSREDLANTSIVSETYVRGDSYRDVIKH